MLDSKSDFDFKFGPKMSHKKGNFLTPFSIGRIADVFLPDWNLSILLTGL